jgi:uncharacterized protein (TIGR03083 family)
MTLPRPEVIAGTQAEQAAFEDLVRSVSAEEWTTPTRCEGWTVRDIAAHVTGTLADIANGNTHLLAQPDSTQRQTNERKGRSPEEIADEMHAAVKVLIDIAATFDDAAWNGRPPVDIPGTLGEAVEGIWYDTYVHAEDIRTALGRPSERGPGVRASVSHLADLLGHQDWGPATLALDGLEEFPVNGGGGRRVTGDALTFVLAATGRTDPAELGLDETVNVYRAT